MTDGFASCSGLQREERSDEEEEYRQRRHGDVGRDSQFSTVVMASYT